MLRNVPPPEVLKSLGRYMPRQRYQRGSLSKVGKRRKMWMGLYHVYVMVAGKEKRREKTRILGPCSEMTKSDAQQKLDQVIADSTRQRGTLPLDPTFAEVWERYRALKAANWGSATSMAVSSVLRHHVLPTIGSVKLRHLTRDPIQTCLNDMATAGASYSALHKARTYIAAALDYAVDEKAVAENPAAKIDVPTKLLTKKIAERFYSLDECRKLLSIAEGREHLIARVFLVCGLRPAELFALRIDDVEIRRLRIDEALKETERGARRIGETKTVKSTGYVSISEDLQREIENWLLCGSVGVDGGHANSGTAPRLDTRPDRQAEPGKYSYSNPQAGSEPVRFLFPSSTGTPFQIRNYLNRILKPLAARAGILDMNYQSLRRTFATHFQRHGTPRSAQAAMRHAHLSMTGHYMKEIPEEVVKSVASWDAELLKSERRLM